MPMWNFGQAPCNYLFESPLWELKLNLKWIDACFGNDVPNPTLFDPAHVSNFTLVIGLCKFVGHVVAWSQPPKHPKLIHLEVIDRIGI